MSQVRRFQEYADAFEKVFENDDWSVLEPYFSEDAVYETIAGPPFGGKIEGRKALFAQLKQNLDGFDRRFDSRELELLEGPAERDGKVWIRWRATYRLAGKPPLVLEGEETASFEGDRIRRLEDRFGGDASAVTGWLEQYGALLGTA